jgi:hypothetical protein
MKNSTLWLATGLFSLSMICATILFGAEIPGTGWTLSSPTSGQQFATGVSIPVTFATQSGSYYSAYLCSGTSSSTAIAGLTGTTLRDYFTTAVTRGQCITLLSDYLATDIEFSGEYDEFWFQTNYGVSLPEDTYQLHVVNGCDAPLFGSQNQENH